ncbi:MAG: hypothetical protein ABNH49_11375 [Hyphomonas sp.]
MAENVTLKIAENSAEQVAYKLMVDISNVEDRELYSHGKNPADREWILRTYAQCLTAVKQGAYVEM